MLKPNSAAILPFVYQTVSCRKDLTFRNDWPSTEVLPLSLMVPPCIINKKSWLTWFHPSLMKQSANLWSPSMARCPGDRHWHQWGQQRTFLRCQCFGHIPLKEIHFISPNPLIGLVLFRFQKLSQHKLNITIYRTTDIWVASCKDVLVVPLMCSTLYHSPKSSFPLPPWRRQIMATTLKIQGIFKWLFSCFSMVS